MGKYKLMKVIGEGTFSVVWLALSLQNGKLVAIKRMKTIFRSIEQVNALREIQALKRLANFPNIIKLYEVLYDKHTGKLALVFELMTCNLYDIIKNKKEFLPEKKVKLYIYQVLRALDFMHRNGIFHRDIKPENILIANDLAKIADLGSCRGIFTNQPFSEYISTRWYRAPECLLTDGYYNYKMDIWGVGCVLFEVMMLYPLFPGKDELDQIHKIHSILGTPSKEQLAKLKKSVHMDFNFAPQRGKGLRSLLHDAPNDLVDLLTHMLAYDEDERYTARQCLRHPYFAELYEADRHARRPSPSPGLSTREQNHSATNQSGGVPGNQSPSNQPGGGAGGSSSLTSTNAVGGQGGTGSLVHPSPHGQSHRQSPHPLDDSKKSGSRLPPLAGKAGATNSSLDLDSDTGRSALQLPPLQHGGGGGGGGGGGNQTPPHSHAPRRVPQLPPIQTLSPHNTNTTTNGSPHGRNAGDSPLPAGLEPAAMPILMQHPQRSTNFLQLTGQPAVSNSPPLLKPRHGFGGNSGTLSGSTQSGAANGPGGGGGNGSLQGSQRMSEDSKALESPSVLRAPQFPDSINTKQQRTLAGQHSPSLQQLGSSQTKTSTIALPSVSHTKPGVQGTLH